MKYFSPFSPLQQIMWRCGELDGLFLGICQPVQTNVYIWRDGHFRHFRGISTSGAVDLHPFSVCGKNLMAVANAREGKCVIPGI